MVLSILNYFIPMLHVLLYQSGDLRINQSLGKNVIYGRLTSVDAGSCGVRLAFCCAEDSAIISCLTGKQNSMCFCFTVRNEELVLKVISEVCFFKFQNIVGESTLELKSQQFLACHRTK